MPGPFRCVQVHGHPVLYCIDRTSVLFSGVMIRTSTERVAKTRDFSVAFERICNLVAIAETQRPHETLRGLVQQCMVVLPTESFRNEADFVDALDVLFGVEASPPDVKECLDELVTAKSLRQSPTGVYLLDEERKSLLSRRVDEATNLERRVRESWLGECQRVAPGCRPDQLWLALRAFLTSAFRRHGLQAARLLDPSLVNDNGEEPLSDLLRSAVDTQLPIECRPDGRVAISAFLAQLEPILTERSTSPSSRMEPSPTSHWKLIRKLRMISVLVSMP